LIPAMRATHLDPASALQVDQEEAARTIATDGAVMSCLGPDVFLGPFSPFAG
jgi:hypothetical protein